jgi:hypothetical protein
MIVNMACPSGPPVSMFSPKLTNSMPSFLLARLHEELLRDVTKSFSVNPCSDDSKGDGAEART